MIEARWLIQVMKTEKNPSEKMRCLPGNDAEEDLIRVVKTPEDDILIDLREKSPGAVPTYAVKFLVLNWQRKAKPWIEL